MTMRILDRRTFLRASGVSIALPFLDAMVHGQQPAARPRRMVLIGRPLGFHAPYFFPENAGRDYRPSRYLQLLNGHREDFTVFSGMSHRGYPGGHHIEVALFTGVGGEGVRNGTDIRNTISLDQEVAARLGSETRFASLVLGGGDLAWNRRGVRIPSQSRATQIFRQLFLRGTPAEIARETRRIQDGQSILDDVREQARGINGNLGAADRQRMDLFLSSVREAEQRLQQDEAWVNRPRPQVNYTPPTDDYLVSRLLERTRQWYDIIHLALQTDSTRIVSLYIWSHERPELNGVTMAHHDASHHGQDDAKIRQLAAIEEAEVRLFGGFINKLKTTTEGAQTLLERTAVLYASNLGNASSHTCDNLPIILAGGGFRHQGHVVYNRTDNMPLSNLFLRMIRQMGLETRSFGSSTGAIGEV
jgi:Protein of unknown function (DUF1552)